MEHRTTGPLQHNITDVKQRNEFCTEAEISCNELNFKRGGRDTSLSLANRCDGKHALQPNMVAPHTRSGTLSERTTNEIGINAQMGFNRTSIIANPTNKMNNQAR
eukprot:8974551-Lingulodinium_polyedra.AAC.1